MGYGTSTFGPGGMPLKLGRYFLEPIEAAVTLTEGTPNLITSLGAGTPAIAELNDTASELSGFALDTSDEVYWNLALCKLWDADLAGDIWARLHLDIAAAGITPTGADFRLAVKGVAIGEVAGDAKASPDKSIDFVDLVVAAGSAGRTVVTEFKAFDAAGMFAADLKLQIAVTLQSRGSAAADAIKLTGVELAYTLDLSDPSGVRQTT